MIEQPFDFKRDFINLAIDCKVLQFGEFKLKSGRISPYFFNAGRFLNGGAMLRLGRCYASALNAADLAPEVLFGPAYKGIPLVTATATALADNYNIELPFFFDRKEVKQHGEGGQIVGIPSMGRAILIDDVITAGTAIRKSMETLKKFGVRGTGVLIGLDRCERGMGALSAVQEVERDCGLKVISVIDLADIICWLDNTPRFKIYRADLELYRDQFGIDLTVK